MNVITDRQSLKRCVKQIVRNCLATETQADCFLDGSPWGAEALSQHQRDILFDRRKLGRALLQADEVAVISAFDAMGFSDCSEDALRQGLTSYEREAWFREILDTARVSQVLVPIEMGSDSEWIRDSRIQPELALNSALFAPGRYGINYESCAEQIRDASRARGCRFLKLTDWCEEQLRYCVLPVCEEEKLILDLQIEDFEKLRLFLSLYDEFGYFHAIISVCGQMETLAMNLFSDKKRILLRLSDLSHLPEALKKLGLHFIPYSSHAGTAEELLGRWIQAREKIWPELVEAYLPMAKAGCELTDEMLEKDISLLLGGNVRAWET